MFFKISKSTDNSYPQNHKLVNNTFFNCDLGWTKTEHNGFIMFFKGYIFEDISQQQLLEDILVDPTPKHKGNFFAILSLPAFAGAIAGHEVVISHSVNRGSPLQYTQNECVSNLPQDMTMVYADKYVKIGDNLTVSVVEYSPLSELTELNGYEAVLEKVDSIICNTFEDFLTRNIRPLKFFFSGGIDTLTLYSYLTKFTKDFEFVDYEYVKFTHFWCNNEKQIKNHWCYTQMHSWGDLPTALVTGGCGDEYLLRGPKTISLLMQHYNIDILDLLQQNTSAYHYKYFYKDVNAEIFNTTVDIDVTDKQKVVKYILDILLNDHQHWGIDETLFVSPFANIDIPSIMLNYLPKENLINQVLDAQFNKDLIKMNNPDNLRFLSPYKNYDNPLSMSWSLHNARL